MWRQTALEMDDCKPNKITLEGLVLKFNKLLNGENDSNLLQKSSQKSVEARQAGNNLFRRGMHDKKIHREILSLYTKSIALAEENSEELAFGYGNRSALLFHLQKYKECLIDIERACKITKSDELKKKLLARKQDCILQLSKVRDVDEKLPLLNFKPSKENSCLSQLITIQCNKKYGRHIVASQDIKSGTVIAVEKGTLLFPNMENLHLNCSHCLSVAWNGIPCRSCAVAVYCNEKCKEEAWQQYHDVECQVLPYLDFLEKSSGCIGSAALTVRLFIEIIKSEGLANIIKQAELIDNNNDKQLYESFDVKLFQGNKFQSIYNLSCGEQNTLQDHVICNKVIELLCKKSKIFNETVEENVISKKIDQSSILGALKVFEKLRNITRNNSYTFESYYDGIKDFEGMDFGSFTGIFCSMFNHSCICNVKRLFTNNQEVVLFTTNFIPKGHQLFVNYGTSDKMTKKERLDILKRHDFVCDCQACTENWPPLITTIESFDAIDLKMFQEFEKFHVMDTFYVILQGPKNWVHTKKSLEDVDKIISIIRKRCSGLKAQGLIHIFSEFIIDHYENFYAIRHNIPDNC